MTAIHIDNLDVSYGETQITYGVSIDVEEGGSFALVGESGSGKSTVLKAIAGLAPEWRGTIEIFGKPRSHGHRRRFCPHLPDGLPGPLRLAASAQDGGCDADGTAQHSRG